jgi:hypothetical protein
MFLQTAQIPAAKLQVYAGGITEWKAGHLPLELGPRNSGRISHGD